MKKLTKLIALMLVIAALSSVLVSCGGTDAVGTATLVIEGESITEYEVSLDEFEGNTVADMFNYLKASKGLAFEYSGTMVTQVGDVKNDDSAGKWVYFWTSVVSDMDVTEWVSYVEYDGKQLASSGKNVFEMTVADGAVIYVGYYR